MLYPLHTSDLPDQDIAVSFHQLVDHTHLGMWRKIWVCRFLDFIVGFQLHLTLNVRFFPNSEVTPYGASLCIAFQAITDLYHIYGENLANSLIGQCDKAAYLRSLDRKTADWASNQIGNMRLTWRSQTTGTSLSTGQLMFGGSASFLFGGSISTSESYSQQREQIPAFEPEAIQNAPKPDLSAGRGVLGFFRCGQYAYQHEISSAFLSQQMCPAAVDVQGFVAADDEIEGLRLWDHDDIDRLGIGHFLEVFEGKDLKALPFEDWVRFGQEAGIPDVDLLSEDDGDSTNVP